MAKPIVAIVGRPNVGKSTLFNRLIGERRAIVEDEPGTTRDRVYGTTDWGGVEFTVIDTGGLQDDQEVETGSLTQIAHHTREQAHVAIGEADVIVFMVDAQSGVNAGDHEVADMLRRADKPTILVANKADSVARRDAAVEFYELGSRRADRHLVVPRHWHRRSARPHRRSAARGRGRRRTRGPAIAIVGRPNVGKSRLLNALLGQERSIVSDVPGTTRDSLDTVFDWAGQPITLIDTAGIRRRGRVDRGIEQYSVLRSMRAIDRADVVLLVIDATEGFTAQDLHIAGYVEEQKKGVVVVVNKWDLIEKDSSTMEEYREQARAALDFMPYAPLVFVSAKFGQRVQQVIDTALAVVERAAQARADRGTEQDAEGSRRSTPAAEQARQVAQVLLRDAGRRVAADVHLLLNDPEQIHFSYRRYLENKLRETFGFTGTAIRMSFRGRDEGR